MKDTLSGALPEAGDGLLVSRAVGATFAATVTAMVVELLAPLSSDTVSVAVQFPAAYVWGTLEGRPSPEAAVVPSPKSRVHEAITPSESELVEPLKVTLSGALPVAGVGVEVMRAVGATFAFEVTAIVFGAEVAPSLSVTVREAVYDPAA